MFYSSRICIIIFHLFLVQFVAGQTQADLDALNNLPQDAYWVIGHKRNTKTFKQDQAIYRYDISDPLTRKEIAIGTDPILSPDGQTVAYSVTPNDPDDQISEIWLMNSDGTDNRMLIDNIPFLRRPQWDAESKFIYFMSSTNPPTSWGVSGNLWKIEVETVKKDLLYSRTSEFFFSFDVHNDKAFIARGPTTNGVWVNGSDTARVREVQLDPTDPTTPLSEVELNLGDDVTYSPGGNRVVFTEPTQFGDSAMLQIWERKVVGWEKIKEYKFSDISGNASVLTSWTNHPEYIILQDRNPSFEYSSWLLHVPTDTFTRLNWAPVIFNGVSTMYFPNAPIPVKTESRIFKMDSPAMDKLIYVDGGVFQFKLTGQHKVKLYNTSGQLVWNQSVSGPSRIQLDFLSPGLYRAVATP